MRAPRVNNERSAGRNNVAAIWCVATKCVAAIAIVTMPVSLMAQSASPSGSPLDSYQSFQSANPSSSTSNSSNSSTNADGPSNSNNEYSTRIEPVNVNSSDSDSTDRNSDDSSSSDSQNGSQNSRNTRSGNTAVNEATLKRPAPPSEYELFIQRTVGKKLPRFGADLLMQSARDFAVPSTSAVPSTYVLNPGDQIFIGLSGSLDGTVDAKIDTDGLIFLPKVGPVRLAGVTYGSLKSVLTRAIGTQYRDFRVAVAITKLRGIRVYVTGFANNPGAYSVTSLSTMVNAVFAAGGPSSGGSFRKIQLYRNGELISDFDLYDLIRKGDKSKDAILQNEDVLYIPPVGPQIALTGSVNAEAIYEARPGERLSTVLGFAGGPATLADSSRVILYTIENRDKLGGVEIARSEFGTTPISAGDIVQVLSSGSLAQPLERQSVIVRIEGEVNRPGNYYVRPNSSLDEVMTLAGGLTPRAFVYGTNFQRVSVRLQQQESFNEAVQQFEISLAAAPILKDSALDVTTGAAQIASSRAVLDRLKKAEPDGRVVLDISPLSSSLPSNLILENNDRIFVPFRPTTVGVFGAVYRPASFLIADGKTKTVEKYLEMAGGPMRAGDKGQLFVVRANGAVISKQNGALGAHVLPGDVIFVPVKTQNTSFWAKLQQISTIVFQFGLSAAAFYAVTK